MLNRAVLFALAAIVTAALVPAAAAQPFRVANLNRTGGAWAAADPHFLATAGRLTYFTVREAGEALALWATDGSAEETRKIGLGGDPDEIFAGAVGTLGDLFFFTAFTIDGALPQLRVYDPRLGRAIRLAQDVLSPSYEYVGAISDRGLLVFRAQQAELGCQLWVSDGTVEGTRRLADCLGSLSTAPEGPTRERELLFGGAHPTLGSVLWKTDGSTVEVVVDPTPKNTDHIGDLTLLGDRVLFRVFDGRHRSELWSSDGSTEGTQRLQDGVEFLSDGYRTSTLRVVGDRAFFLSQSSGSRQVYRTDGTPAGTAPWSRIAGSEVGSWVVAAGERVYFSARRDGQDELWAGWAADAAPQLVDRICASTACNGFSPLGSVGGRLVLAARGATPPERPPVREGPGEIPTKHVDFPNEEVWVSDGSAAGTRRLADVCVGTTCWRPTPLGRAGGMLLLLASDGWRSVVWRTDGTPAGTFAVTAVDPPRVRVFSQSTAVAGELLLFTFDDGVRGAAPWRSDGTVEGTFRLGDLGTPVDRGSEPAGLMARGDRVYFAADDGIHGPQVWSSDGTAAGTVRLTDLPTLGVEEGDRIGSLAFVGDDLYFVARTQKGPEVWVLKGGEGEARSFPSLRVLPDRTSFHALGRRVLVASLDLWSTDGTDAGSEKLISRSRDGALLGDLYLTSGPGPGRQPVLWASDGTTAGTRRLREDAVEPAAFMELDGGLAFLTGDREGRRLWWTDGSTAGTRVLFDPLPNWLGSAAAGPGGRRLFFFASGQDGKADLWAIAASPDPSGLTRLAGFSAEDSGALWESLGHLGSHLYFIVHRSGEGPRALWRSDGTPGGTGPAPVGALRDREVVHVQDWNGRLLVLAETFGRSQPLVEFWTSDGTADGTRMLGRMGSYDLLQPEHQPFATTRSHVFFPASDPSAGTELWALPYREASGGGP